MNRPTLVRRIYAELRVAAPATISSAELLHAANEIAEAYASRDRNSRANATYYTGSTPFECWALDRAMADGGWRVLGYESGLTRDVFDDQTSSEEFDLDSWITEHAA
jgi:hypothetical protein